MDKLTTKTTPPAVQMQKVSYTYPNFLTGTGSEAAHPQ